MPRNPDKRPCSVEGCKAWAIRGSDPPLCAPHTPGKTGAPRGNRNAMTHGFYLTGFRPGELGDLRERLLQNPLDTKRILTHLALSRLQRMIRSGVTLGPRPRPLDFDDYARFVDLTFRGVGAIARILRARHCLPGNDGWDELMDTALDPLSEEQGHDPVGYATISEELR